MESGLAAMQHAQTSSARAPRMPLLTLNSCDLRHRRDSVWTGVDRHRYRWTIRDPSSASETRAIMFASVPIKSSHETTNPGLIRILTYPASIDLTCTLANNFATFVFDSGMICEKES